MLVIYWIGGQVEEEDEGGDATVMNTSRKKLGFNSKESGFNKSLSQVRCSLFGSGDDAV